MSRAHCPQLIPGTFASCIIVSDATYDVMSDTCKSCSLDHTQSGLILSGWRVEHSISASHPTVFWMQGFKLQRHAAHILASCRPPSELPHHLFISRPCHHNMIPVWIAFTGHADESVIPWNRLVRMHMILRLVPVIELFYTSDT